MVPDGMSRSEKLTTVCLLGLIVGLLAVGVVSHEIIRHVIQVVPALLVLAAVARRWSGATFAALAVFLFWFLLMTAIWLFLLGLARIVSGTFSPAETALTVVIGAACAGGIAAAPMARRNAPWARSLIAFAAAAALQMLALWVSVQPAFAHR